MNRRPLVVVEESNEPILRDPSAAILVDRPKISLVGFARRWRESAEPGAGGLENVTVERGEQDLAIGPIGKGAHIVAGPTLVGSAGAPFGGFKNDEADAGADPKSAAPVDMQIDNGRSRETGSVLGIEHLEIESIEADEPIPGSEPEKPIASKRDGIGGVLRESVLGFPSVDQVLRIGTIGRPGRLRREGSEAEPEGQPEPKKPKRPGLKHFRFIVGTAAHKASPAFLRPRTWR
jgi:hypothetical protein